MGSKRTEDMNVNDVKRCNVEYLQSMNWELLGSVRTSFIEQPIIGANGKKRKLQNLVTREKRI